MQFFGKFLTEINISLTVALLAIVFLEIVDMTNVSDDSPGATGPRGGNRSQGLNQNQRRREGRRRRENRGRRARLVQRLMRSRVKDGTVRLVDGPSQHEGRVEIYHKDRWGPVCDDDWDVNDASVVCRQLGYDAELNNTESLKVDIRSTHSGRYGHAQVAYWLDNVYCEGREKELTDCRHEGWGVHDCGVEETAGVICARSPNSDEIIEDKLARLTSRLPPTPSPHQILNLPRKKFHSVFDSTHQNEPGDRIQQSQIQIRLRGGRVPHEGRVEVRLGSNSNWGLICGDGWSLLEAGVICRQLKLGFAEGAPQTDYFGGSGIDIVTSGVKCTGQEDHLSQCSHHDHERTNLSRQNEVSSPSASASASASTSVFCPGSGKNFAAVVCNHRLPDLVPDALEIQRSAYLEDKLLYSLQCAMEENCLASSAYRNQEANPHSWHTETRRLLRFTARIVNTGNADFRPAIPKYMWQFHACHMHYHSMEVFAVFDILDHRGRKVAEGHKASFCLEDNECIVKKENPFACASFGDQGISVGCADIYRANIDCQWIDITDIVPGMYTFKVSINGEMKVAESDFSNNGVTCSLQYTETSIYLSNCTLSFPWM